MLKPDPKFQKLLARIAPLACDEYYNLVFHFDESHYRARVEMVGFTGAGRVLDVGCGYGQWAVALAGTNAFVTAIDPEPGMLEISGIVAREYGTRNVEFRLGRLPHLDIPDEHFDLVWCWGVLMFVDRVAALRELRRVLRPGGRLLVGCVNGRGRVIFKLARAANPFRFRRATVSASLRTAWSGNRPDAVPNFTSRRQAADLCREAGLDLEAVGFDGTIDVSGRGLRRPMFPQRFLGLENNIEFLARRPEAAAAGIDKVAG
jgi:SAM-dependent methyltransferase